jgi:hypothetical protein
VSAHTPGPWRVVENPGWENENELPLIVVVGPEYEDPNGDPENTVVCEGHLLMSEEDDSPEVRQYADEADAHVRADFQLIAAAPDLLWALEALVNHRNEVAGCEFRWEQAREAIRKARGES